MTPSGSASGGEPGAGGDAGRSRPMTRREMKALGIALTTTTAQEPETGGLPWHSAAAEAAQEAAQEAAGPAEHGPAAVAALAHRTSAARGDAGRAVTEGPRSGTAARDVGQGDDSPVDDSSDDGGQDDSRQAPSGDEAETGEVDEQADDTSTGRRPVVVAPLTARGIRTVDETGAITAVQAAVTRAVEAATSPASWESAVALPAVALGIADVAGDAAEATDGSVSRSPDDDEQHREEQMADGAGGRPAERPGGPDGVRPDGVPPDSARPDGVSPDPTAGVEPGSVDADDGSAARETVEGGPRRGASATPAFEAAPSAATAESRTVLGDGQGDAPDVPDTVADDVRRAEAAGDPGVAQSPTAGVERNAGLHTDAAAGVPATVADDVDRAQRAAAAQGGAASGPAQGRGTPVRAVVIVAAVIALIVIVWVLVGAAPGSRLAQPEAAAAQVAGAVAVVPALRLPGTRRSLRLPGTTPSLGLPGTAATPDERGAP